LPSLLLLPDSAMINITRRLCTVAHTYNSSYLGGRDWEHQASSPAFMKVSEMHPQTQLHRGLSGGSWSEVIPGKNVRSYLKNN
jgi:hypothetical protein